LDYQQLDRPALVRKQAQSGVSSAVKQNGESIPDVDYLDIPAFLRRQEEV
jgi:cell division protein FtsZ